MSNPGIGLDLRTATKKDGSKLADFSVSNQTAILGEPFDPIHDGEFTAIEFFGTYCGPCIRFIPTLMQHAIKYKNLKILQISPEAPAKLKGFYKGVKSPFCVSAVPQDLWEDISNVVNLRGIPHIIVLRHGVPVFSGHPMEPELEPLLKKINTEIEDAKKAKAAETQ